MGLAEFRLNETNKRYGDKTAAMHWCEVVYAHAQREAGFNGGQPPKAPTLSRPVERNGVLYGHSGVIGLRWTIGVHNEQEQ